MIRHLIPALFVALFIAPSAQAQDAKLPGQAGGQSLFDGQTLAGWKVTDFGGEGEVKVDGGVIVMKMGQPLTGITWTDASKIPTDNFEITLQAMKRKGEDFFCCLTFPVRESHASFVVGGWAGTVVGLSSINGLDASENETTQYEKFDQSKWYAIRVRVAGGKIECWIDDKSMVDVDLKDKRISTRIEVDPNRPLGVACYNTEAGLKDIRLRKLPENK